VSARACLLAAVLAAPVVAAGADPVPAGGIPDLTGPRSLALGASIGVAAGNEGVFVNPAALAARRRYSVEALGLVERRGASTGAAFFGASVVDSVSAPVTAGFAYTRAAKGDYDGNLWHLALAGAVAEKLYLGGTVKHYAARSATDSVNAATVDAGFFWEPAELVSVGATGYNLIPVAHDLVAPRAFGAGLSVGSDQAFHVTADWRIDLDRTSASTNRYAVGAEVLLGNLVPVRAGWMKDETLGTQWGSVGAGLVSRQGVALDLGYRQSFDAGSAFEVGASLKVFFLE
jgi:hypothetical protein